MSFACSAGMAVWAFVTSAIEAASGARRMRKKCGENIDLSVAEVL
jgi:hypothetical protein